MAGDSISVAPGGAAEIQIDYANFVRIAGDSEVRIANLDSGHYQIQLAKGLLTYRVLRQANTQPEIATALIAVRPNGLSAARVEVFPDGSTHVTVRHGQVEVYTPKGTERANEGSLVTVRGAADDPEYQVASALAPDQWDNWNDQRDAYLSRSQSSRYVSQDVYGAEDLDTYGRWSNDPAYGNVWTPNVSPDWAPYRNGQWAWEDYYGWTWVDADPWGWAPFHYGSWYFRTGLGWSWFPGERFHHYWWHPAMVGFFGFGGGFGVGFGFGNVGWIPLAPFEAFRPWYGRGFYGGRATFAAGISRNVNVAGMYRNARFAGGATAVTAADFQRGNFRNTVAVDRGQLQQASLARGGVPITPSSENLRFTNRAAPANVPHTDVSNQRFFSRASVGPGSAQRTPFAQQQAAVRSSFEPGRSSASGPSSTSGAAGWQRFGTSQPNYAPSAQRFSGSNPSAESSRGFYSGSGGYAGGQRQLQVAPPIVRQREASPSYSAPSYNRGGSGFGSPAPSYRSAPAPSYRSAPAPSYHGGGGGGGGHAPAPSGGHGGRR